MRLANLPVSQTGRVPAAQIYFGGNRVTGRAQNSLTAFTPQGQRASGKALTLIRHLAADKDIFVQFVRMGDNTRDAQGGQV